MKDKIQIVMVLFVFALTSSVYSAQELRLTALNSMERIGQNQEPYGAAKVEIKSAKNEVESFQVVITALKENIRVVNVEITDLIAKDGSKIGKENIKLFRAEYVRVRRSTRRAELGPGLYADPLVPFINPLTGKPIEPRRQFSKRWGEPVTTVGHEMYAVPFDLFRGQNQPVWVDVYIPKDVPAGVYNGKVAVTVLLIKTISAVSTIFPGTSM